MSDEAEAARLRAQYGQGFGYPLYDEETDPVMLEELDSLRDDLGV